MEEVDEFKFVQEYLELKTDLFDIKTRIKRFSGKLPGKYLPTYPEWKSGRPEKIAKAIAKLVSTPNCNLKLVTIINGNIFNKVDKSLLSVRCTDDLIWQDYLGNGWIENPMIVDVTSVSIDNERVLPIVDIEGGEIREQFSMTVPDLAFNFQQNKLGLLAVSPEIKMYSTGEEY